MSHQYATDYTEGNRLTGTIPQIYIPRRWYNFLSRVARMEEGKAYTIIVIMPKCADAEPIWVVREDGKVENQR